MKATNLLAPPLSSQDFEGPRKSHPTKGKPPAWACLPSPGQPGAALRAGVRLSIGRPRASDTRGELWLPWGGRRGLRRAGPAPQAVQEVSALRGGSSQGPQTLPKTPPHPHRPASPSLTRRQPRWPPCGFWNVPCTLPQLFPLPGTFSPVSAQSLSLLTQVLDDYSQ